MSLTKQKSESLYKRVVVYWTCISPCCFKLGISNAIKEVTQRQVDNSKLRFSRVLIKIKRKIDLIEEEQESGHEESKSSGDESEDVEPRI